MNSDLITRRRAIVHIGDRRLVYNRAIDENNETEDSFDERMEIERAENTSIDNMSTEESHGDNIENISMDLIEESRGK